MTLKYRIRFCGSGDLVVKKQFGEIKVAKNKSLFEVVVMKIYLRFLAVCYFVAFALHLLDVLDLRLQFSQMTIAWKLWILFLMVADGLAAMGLYKQRKWGVGLFVIIAFLQLFLYSGILDKPQNQLFLIVFHAVTLAIYFLLRRLQLSSSK